MAAQHLCSHWRERACFSSCLTDTLMRLRERLECIDPQLWLGFHGSLLNCLQLQMEYWRNVQWLRSEEPWAPFELPHNSAYLKPHSILQQGPVKWRLKHIRYVPFTRNKCSFTAKAVMWGLKIKRPGEDARFLISIVGDCVCKSFRDIGPTTATLIKLVNMAFGYSQWQRKKRPTLNLQADYSECINMAPPTQAVQD